MALPTTSAELRAKATPQPPVDPNTKVPKAVRDAGIRAEAIQRAALGEAEPSVVATPPNGAEPPQPPPNGAEPPQPPPNGAEPQPPQPPVHSQVPQTQQPVMPQPTAPQQPVDWESRFNAMKGRYDRLVTDVGAMSEQMRNLQTENAALRQNAPTPVPPFDGTPPPSLLTEQEIQDYGPEFIDVVRRAAAEIAAPLQEEVRTLRGQLGTVQQETGNSFLTRMNATISGLIPNWQALNQDPRFVQWVGLPEVYSGVIRQELMQQAWNSGDAQRVAAFFRAFLAEEAAVDPHAGQARANGGFPTSLAPAPPTGMVPAATPGGVPLQTRLSLDTLVAPGRAHSAAQQPADKPVYTAQDITKFYTDVAAGKWRAREAERAAIDADIIAAQHEGRIIPDQRTTRPMGFHGGRQG
jgi:hypothetical protein